MNYEVEQLIKLTENLNTQELLDFLLRRYGGKVALASSFGAEDQVLTDMMCNLVESPEIFTLDTGRLPEQTHKVLEATRVRYGIGIEVLFPDNALVEGMVFEHGTNLFYDSVEMRKRCCYVRKVEPLKRKLANLDLWICGLRAEQSSTRVELGRIEYDEQFGLIKINPLADWSTERVWEYIKLNNVPYNSLHDKGYPSIGCSPCTRAIGNCEDIRAGRWWWENPEHKECGLHISKNNKGVF